ncbi:carbohydrate-binding family 9-like protein [Rhodocytophaga aerolata]|uniref:Carbohydrate-binding family 9-like protein n=1 Tax=Rhodocytophaga aerolata TaxID=455078 RepID=A0ABT8RAZ3_9BACT|nr:carbohydrate-binding family 9-like protein [Rhodocytophaga aerolata]MDO1449282.1 carbohydrate-binding family 9-like protein [Rhodocytophaga aerolata]
MDKKYGCSEKHIAHYTSCRTPKSIEINGDLEKPVWQRAQKSPRFVDMVTGEPGFFDTRSAVLWDDQNLYIAFWVEEPFVQAHLTERDSLIFNENDIEVFIDGDDAYYEFEINALGTVYEVFFIWRDAYKKGSKFDVPEFDLIDQKALSFGGNEDRMADSFWHGRHPRKTRWAFINWDFPGMQSAVRVQGTINDNTDIDKGWTVELAFPWAGMKSLANGRSLPPKDGDTWRLFLGRFQKLTPSGQEVNPHPAWAWNRHGVYDTHLPECFTYIHFSDKII